MREDLTRITATRLAYVHHWLSEQEVQHPFLGLAAPANAAGRTTVSSRLERMQNFLEQWRIDWIVASHASQGGQGTNAEASLLERPGVLAGRLANGAMEMDLLGLVIPQGATEHDTYPKAVVIS